MKKESHSSTITLTGCHESSESDESNINEKRGIDFFFFLNHFLKMLLIMMNSF